MRKSLYEILKEYYRDNIYFTEEQLDTIQDLIGLDGEITSSELTPDGRVWDIFDDDKSISFKKIQVIWDENVYDLAIRTNSSMIHLLGSKDGLSLYGSFLTDNQEVYFVQMHEGGPLEVSHFDSDTYYDMRIGGIDYSSITPKVLDDLCISGFIPKFTTLDVHGCIETIGLLQDPSVLEANINNKNIEIIRKKLDINSIRK